MGMFDSVFIPCPACARIVEFQSKAGDCCLYEYTIENAPPAVLGDLSGESVLCECGMVVCVAVKVSATAFNKTLDSFNASEQQAMTGLREFFPSRRRTLPATK